MKDENLAIKWEMVKSELRAKYQELDDEDVSVTPGDEHEMACRISRKVGRKSGEFSREIRQMMQRPLANPLPPEMRNKL